MAIYFSKNGETKEIATYESCISQITVSDPSSWGNTYSASNGSLKLTVPSNGTTSVRNETVVISYKAGSNNCSKNVAISQEAGDPAPVETVFTYCDSTTAYSQSFDEGATSFTLCVTSTSGSAQVGYSVASSCDWITASTTSTGIRLVIAANTGAYRQCSFYVTQATTNKKLLVAITQSATTAGEFYYCDGTTAKTQNTDSEAKNFRYCVVSKIGGYASQSYAVVGTLPSWITVTTAGTYFNVVLTENTTSAERTYNMTLKQTGSTSTITLAIAQTSANCNEFLDSCCGKSSWSHPEYDMGLHYDQGYQNADGILFGSTFHVTNTLPSWLGVTIDYQTGVVFYNVLETNTGGYREFTVNFALDTTTGTNVCSEASVLVRQDANPDQLMQVNLNIVNQGSSTVKVASIKWTFGNGYITHTRISENVPAGQGIADYAKFLKTMNNQELFIGHPVDVILDDGTVKSGNINSLLITSGNTYTISFT